MCHTDSNQQALTDPLPFLKQVLSEVQHLSFLFHAQPLRMLHLCASNPRGCFPLLPAVSLCTQLHTVTWGACTRLLVWEKAALFKTEKTHINSWAPVWGSRNLYFFIDGGLVYKWLASKSSESVTQVPNRSQNCQGCFFYIGWFVERR